MLALAGGACVPQADAASAEELACRAMCEHLVGDLGGCGDAGTIEACGGECEVHLRAGASTAGEVDCGAGASDCVFWAECGDLL